MSLVLTSTGGKSHLVHLIDTPGHVNFVDEVASAIRLVDGIVLVVDVVEGVSHTKTPSHHEIDRSIGNVQYRSHHQTRNSGECQDYSCRKQNRQTYPGVTHKTSRCIL